MSEYFYKGSGLAPNEKAWGETRFSEYRKNYPHLHKMSDLLLLEELIFQEACHERLKIHISDLINKDTQKTTIPVAFQSSVKESLDLQFKLKEKLGLFEDKKKLDAFRDFELLRDDFREYRRQNPNLFKTTCPQCSFIFFLKRRTDCYETFASPMFKDKVLCNPELWDAYKKHEITKERLARILGVAVDYVDWLEEKIFPSNSPAEAPEVKHEI